MGSKDISTVTMLTRDILAYQKSGINSKSIFNTLYLIIYRYPVKRGYLQEEHASEFLLFLVPKLERIIKRYQFQGVSFESYLRNTIYWQIKTFIQLRNAEIIKEKIYTKFYYNCVEQISFYDKEPDFFNESSVCDSEQLYTPSSLHGFPNTMKGKKKMLIIALIHADIIKKSVAAGVASVCSIPFEKLNAWIQELRDSLDDRYENVQKLKTQRNSAFFTLLELQTKLRGFNPESKTYQTVNCKIELHQKQLTHLHDALRRAQGKIHYENVAKILDIPRGTVASTVFYARRISEEIKI